MTSVETKVGLFVFLGLFLLGLFVIKAGDVSWLKRGYYVEFVFPNVSGLKIGSPIRLAGVLVGTVREVKVVYDRQNKKASVEVYAYINESARFPIDSRIQIVPIGLLGDKGIEITPGIDYEHMVSEGDVLYGQKETDLQDLIEEGRMIAKEIRKGLSSLNRIIADEEIVSGIKEAVLKFGDASGELEKTLQDVRSILSAVKSGDGTLGRFVYDDSIYVLLELTAYDLNKKMNLILDEIKRHPWKLFIKTKERRR